MDISLLGVANGNLTYDDGQLSLTYHGGKDNCHGQFERKTIINFKCDHATHGSNGPSYIEETSDCTYIFEWSTSLACMPFQVSAM